MLPILQGLKSTQKALGKKAMKDSRLSIFFRQAPPGSDHGQVGGAVQEEILRFLEMENERSKERHDRHKINISKIYELPRVIERYDWEKMMMMSWCRKPLWRK